MDPARELSALEMEGARIMGQEESSGGYYDGVNTPDNYPIPAAWYIFFAQTENALTTITITQTSSVILTLLVGAS